MSVSPATITRRRWQSVGLTIAVVAVAGPLLVRTAAGSGIHRTARGRLGRATSALIAPHFIAESRPGDTPAIGDSASAPVIALFGSIRADTAATAEAVMVYGVDDRFWHFHHASGVHGPEPGEVILSPSLEAKFRSLPGDTLELRIPQAEDAPTASVHGRRDGEARTIRVRIAQQPLAALADLSPLDSSRDLPAAYVSLSELQTAAPWAGRANAILFAAPAPPMVTRATAIGPSTIDDYGLTLAVDPGADAVAVGARSGLLHDAMSEAVVRAAFDVGGLPTPVLTGVVNGIRSGERTVGYSFVAGLELQALDSNIHAEERSRPPIVLNEPTARQLRVVAGDVVEVNYPVRRAAGNLDVGSGRFEVVGVVPASGVAGSPALTPVLPGITGATSVAAWTPRVPFHPTAIAANDESYWAAFGTAPRAFVPIDVARANWGSPMAAATSVLVSPPEGASLADTRDRLDAALRSRLTPAMVGIHIRSLSEEWQMRADAVERRWLWLSLWSLPLVAVGLVAAAAPVVGTRAARRTAAAVAIVAGFMAVAAVRERSEAPGATPRSPEGGFTLFAETVVAITPAPAADVTAIRVHDVAPPDSALLSGPPLRVAAVDEAFINEGRLQFVAALDRSDEERDNPWLLLRRDQRDRSDPGAGVTTPIVPVVATAGTLDLIGRSPGDEVSLTARGHAIRLRVVGVLADGVFDGALVMRESQFLEWFPSAGYQWLGIAGRPAEVAAVRKGLEAEFGGAGLTFHAPSLGDGPGAHRWAALRLALATSALVTAFGLLLSRPPSPQA